ncbi:MAG: hypothetical protein V1809_13740 [Planctomycetota bacterium]
MMNSECGGAVIEMTTRRVSSNISQSLRALSADVERGVSLSESPDVVVRPIENDDELDEVYRITHDAYVERGYCAPQPDGRLIHYPRHDGIPETIVLVAERNGRIVGTNSLTLDGSKGLPVDEDFGRDCKRIRATGRRLAASWRIATRKDCREERNIVMGLIRETLRLCLLKGVETCLFTFNPRHERIYQKLLNMKTVARSEGTAGLENAPAVLMRCDFENLPAWCLEMVEV